VKEAKEKNATILFRVNRECRADPR
jgi:hypothetical protein